MNAVVNRFLCWLGFHDWDDPGANAYGMCPQAVTCKYCGEEIEL